MPGLIAFRRRWSTGSDDLVVPGIILFILHVTLFIIIAIVTGTSKNLEFWASLDLDSLVNSQIKNETVLNKAMCAHEIRSFSFGYLALLAVAAVIEIIMAGFSMQGTILDPTPRKPVEYLLYVRIIFGIIELIFSVVSAVQISYDWKLCGSLREVYNMQIGIIVVNIIVFLIVLLVGYCVFDPSGGTYYKIQNAFQERSMSASRIDKMRKELNDTVQKTWMNRLSNCFCCVSNNSTNVKQVALDEVATLLCNFFKDYDFVMSDIMAGLTLLRHRQLCIENDTTISDEDPVQEFMCGRPITQETNFVDLSHQVTRKNYEDMTYYCAYGLAAYGPLFYWIENTGTGLCEVLKECLCGDNPTCTSRCCLGNPARRQKSTLIRGKSGCGWALAGIRRSLIDHGLHVDVVYVSLENDVYKQPFFLCVDHERKAVVVTVRGTLAEVDAMTDLVASSASIPSEENDGTWLAHKGMVDSAVFIHKKLLRDMVLSLGFGHDLSKDTRHYDLVLVGHSLGAGVASILALLLHPKYPNLKCYAFSPPGGLMSHSAMIASQSCVQTIVFGKDVVPRVGLPQLEKLRDEVITLLKHTDLPKYRIILGNLCGSLEHRHKLLRSEQLSSRALRVASRREQSVTANTTATTEVVNVPDELYPPGRIYHLVYSSEEIPGCGPKKKKKKRYYLVYADNVADFSDIIVSHQMISHHLPQEVLKTMKKALQHSPNDRINRSYAQSATLPYTENRANSMQHSQKSTGNHMTPTASQGWPQDGAHTSVTIESPSVEDENASNTSESSAEPFLNSNQNNGVNVNAVAEIEDFMSSASSSSSTLSGVQAPLARADSFTLSIPAHSPTSPHNRDVTNNQEEEGTDVHFKATDQVLGTVEGNDSYLMPVNHSLHFNDPQASSTPFLPKNVPENAVEVITTSLLGESTHSEEPNMEVLSSDDVVVDMSGTSMIS